MSHSTVLTWFKELAETTPESKAKPPGAPEQVELDELFTFVQKKTSFTS